MPCTIYSTKILYEDWFLGQMHAISASKPIPVCQRFNLTVWRQKCLTWQLTTTDVHTVMDSTFSFVFSLISVDNATHWQTTHGRSQDAEDASRKHEWPPQTMSLLLASLCYILTAVDLLTTRVSKTDATTRRFWVSIARCRQNWKHRFFKIGFRF